MTEWLGLTIEEWKNVTAALSSVVTAAGLLIGAWWAWRRFRRTPESRAKVALVVEGAWETPPDAADFLLVRISATNDGGRDWTILHDSIFGATLVGCWSLTPQVRNGAESRPQFVDWSVTPASSAELLATNVTLRPGDVWREVVLFSLPDSSTAARAVAYLYVSAPSGDKIDRFEASTLVVKPTKDN